MTDGDQKSPLMKIYKQPGVKDIKPMKARGHFARALAIEDEAGKTTPEALEQLELALQFLD